MGERTVIRGGRVLPHSRAALIEADLLVEGGRIAAIEPSGRIGLGDAREIDARDRLDLRFAEMGVVADAVLAREPGRAHHELVGAVQGYRGRQRRADAVAIERPGFQRSGASLEIGFAGRARHTQDFVAKLVRQRLGEAGDRGIECAVGHHRRHHRPHARVRIGSADSL